jgi:hypothetical protein
MRTFEDVLDDINTKSIDALLAGVSLMALAIWGVRTHPKRTIEIAVATGAVTMGFGLVATFWPDPTPVSP